MDMLEGLLRVLVSPLPVHDSTFIPEFPEIYPHTDVGLSIRLANKSSLRTLPVGRGVQPFPANRPCPAWVR